MTCRLLPFSAASGPDNMAADEVLLETAVAGVASLRFYAWSEATVSLGYFQPERLRREDKRLARLPYVRRPSGGRTLVHHHELTYALALPAGSPWQTRGIGSRPWLCRLHTILADALAEFGVAAQLAACSAGSAESSPLCFHDITAGDLLLGSTKVAGSAQRRQRGALLQHGSVLLATSPHAPGLPGIAELSGRQLSLAALRQAIEQIWVRQTGWSLVPFDWTAAERSRLEHLARTKFGQSSWNAKR